MVMDIIINNISNKWMMGITKKNEIKYENLYLCYYKR